MSVSHIPKAELHVHLEGTAPPWLIKKLAARHNMELPKTLFASEDTFAWNDFLHFLQTYEDASKVIQIPDDYYDVTYEYLKACAAENTLYVEMMYSPEHAERAGDIPSREHLSAIDKAIDNARRDFGIEGRIIMTAVRHYGVDCALKVAKDSLQETSPYIVGFGMGGDETGFPAGLFKEAYAIAHAGGLACTTHAGEVCGPESVWDAIDNLPLSRIGHGVRAIEDPKLIEQIIERDLTLELCPTSNLALRIYPDYASHPFNLIREAGVKVTLNADDPPYFATTIGHEYSIAKSDFGLDDTALVNITRTAIENSYVDAETKQALLAKCVVG